MALCRRRCHLATHRSTWLPRPPRFTRHFEALLLDQGRTSFCSKAHATRGARKTTAIHQSQIPQDLHQLAYIRACSAVYLLQQWQLRQSAGIPAVFEGEQEPEVLRWPDQHVPDGNKCCAGSDYADVCLDERQHSQGFEMAATYFWWVHEHLMLHKSSHLEHSETMEVGMLYSLWIWRWSIWHMHGVSIIYTFCCLQS